MAEAPLRVLQVTATDGTGGADAVAARLTTGLRARGHQAWLAAGLVTRPGSDALQIPTDAVWLGLRRGAARLPGAGLGRAALFYRVVTRPEAREAWRTGLEDIDFPGTAALASLTPAPPDVLHLHNLHGRYFDLRQLPALGQSRPVCLTLHDAWLTTGHCAHPLGCGRWRTGCGDCPDLTIEPAVRADRTAENWDRKRRLLAASRVAISAPSAWLLAQLASSHLAPLLAEARVIPNGIPLDRFSPRPSARARAALGLRPDARVVLVTTGAAGSPWRDHVMVAEVIERLVQEDRPDAPVQVLAVGAASVGHALTTRARGAVVATGGLSPEQMPEAYRAADVYLHAAREDTFPTTVLEALACGVPVVATRVGGIPEQVRATAPPPAESAVPRDATGILVDAGDAEGAARAIAWLFARPDARAALGAAAAADARARFGIDAQVAATEAWYCEILSARHAC